MNDRTIAIRNVYVMMAYAFRAINQRGSGRLETEEFEHLHDLLAEMLIKGIGAQVKRGLHHEYIDRSEELATVRGRIDLTQSFSTRSSTRGKLVCEFDEYEIDTLHNRVLKAVLILLTRHGDVTSERRNQLRRLLPYFENVRLISPREIRWDALTYHRSNASYRLLLGASELIVRGLLPTEQQGETKLAGWISEDRMNMLYERFLREYYSFHHPELSPGASTIAWDFESSKAIGLEQLPTMQTDITLRHNGRSLIIDAKYYADSMQKSRWGKRTVHSNNLYQILSYAKNADTASDGSVSALLLYAQTDTGEQPNLDVIIQGNRVGAQTLNLSRPWEELRGQLEDLLTWLDPA